MTREDLALMLDIDPKRIRKVNYDADTGLLIYTYATGSMEYQVTMTMPDRNSREWPYPEEDD